MYSIEALGRRRRLEANEPKSVRSPLLTVRQVAENWEMSERHIRRMIADGRLCFVRIGRSRGIPIVDARTREGGRLREVRKTLKALIERAAWLELTIALSCDGARHIRSGQCRFSR